MSYNYTTSKADLDKAFKRIDADVRKGFDFGTDEIAWLNRFDTENTPYSFNDDGVIFPIDLDAGVGVAAIEEFGFEPNPSAPDLQEATEDVVHLVKRFNLSKKTRYTERGTTNQRQRVLARSAMKGAEAIRRWVGDKFYGFNDGVVAITDTDISTATPTLTLQDGYGRTDIDNGAFLVEKFPVGERVALVNSGSDTLINANAYGVVTANNPSAGTITLQLAGSFSFSTNGIRVVLANSMATGLDTSITGSDLGKGLVGLLQINTAASLHGLTHPNWLNAYTDTTGGRFNAQRYRRGVDEIANKNGGKLNLLIMDQGVYRDTTALQSAALRFSDPASLSIDGDITARGVTIAQSKRVPPGYVFGMNTSATTKWLPGTGTGIPSENASASFSEGKEYIDRSGYVFAMETIIQLLTSSRAGHVMWSGLDRV